jgi:hypothetical protein
MAWALNKHLFGTGIDRPYLWSKSKNNQLDYLLFQVESIVFQKWFDHSHEIDEYGQIMLHHIHSDSLSYKRGQSKNNKKSIIISSNPDLCIQIETQLFCSIRIRIQHYSSIRIRTRLLAQSGSRHRKNFVHNFSEFFFFKFSPFTRYLLFLAFGSGFRIRNNQSLNPDPIRIQIHYPDFITSTQCCGSGMFYPGYGSRIRGVKKHRIPDPDPQHWFYPYRFLSDGNLEDSRLHGQKSN